MNYQKIHDDIVSRGRARASNRRQAKILLNGYCERHHILPRCMGGTDDPENLVYLSAREHFIMHILLTKIYKENKDLLFACHRLMYTSHNERLNGKTYNTLKKEINDYQRTLNKENHSGYASMSRKRKGRTKETCPGHASTAKKLSGRTKETHEYLNERGKKISMILSGRTKETYSHVAAQANAIRGRTKENHESYAKVSEYRTGRNKRTDPGVAEQAKKISKLPIDLQIEIYKKRELGISGVSIFEWVSSDLGYKISYQTISATYNRIKSNLDFYLNH